MPINKELLDDLGIVGTDISGLNIAYQKLGMSAEDVNKELAEGIALREFTEQYVGELANSLGIRLATECSSEWNDESKDILVHARLTSTDPKTRTIEVNDKLRTVPYPSYFGRDIEANIQLSASNSDYSPKHIQDLFDACSKAAKDLLPDNIPYQQAIKKIMQEFADEVRYDPSGTRSTLHHSLSGASAGGDDEDDEDFSDLSGNDSIKQLKKDLAALLNTQSIDRKKLNAILDRCTYLHNLFIGLLAVQLWRAETGNVGIPDKETFKTYQQKIRTQFVKNASNKKRPILINLHKLVTDDAEPNVSHYVMETLIPNSDESSASRGMENLLFSNDWTVKVETVTVTHTSSGCVITDRQFVCQYNRASSSAKITYEDDPSNQKKYADLEEVYQASKLRIAQKAKQEIIQRLRSGEKIEDILRGSTINIREGHITLLSPLGKKSLGRYVVYAVNILVDIPVNAILSPFRYIPGLKKYIGRVNIASKVSTIAIHENESAQMHSTKSTLKRLQEDKDLKLTSEDILEILECTKDIPGLIAHELATKLSTARIHYRGYFCNYMVNKVSRFRTELLSALNLNRAYFLEGNAELRAFIVEYIGKIKPSANGLLAAHKTQLIHLFNEIQTKPEIRKELITLMNDIWPNDIEKLELSDLKEILSLYITKEEHFSSATVASQARMVPIKIFRVMLLPFGVKIPGKTRREQARIVANYQGAVQEIRMAQLLNIKLIFSCKSAVDRTGLFAAFVQAMIYPKRLIKNLALSLEHGTARRVKEENTPGIPGLQHRADIVRGIKDNSGDDPNEIYAIIREKLLAKIGRMPKAIFNENIFDAVQKKLATQSADTTHPPMVFSSSPRPPRRLPPPPPPSVPTNTGWPSRPPPPPPLVHSVDLSDSGEPTTHHLPPSSVAGLVAFWNEHHNKRR